MYKFLLLLMMSVNVFFSDSIVAQNQNRVYSEVFNNLLKRMRHISNPSIDNELVEMEQDYGSFRDINYSDASRVNWKPILHLQRLIHFSEAYTFPNNKYYKSNSLYNAIVNGLKFWYINNPQSENWWYKQIQEPQLLGQLLINLRFGYKKIPHELENAILERMKKEGGDPAEWTGANQVDMAEHWIYRACLANDEKDLSYGIKYLFESIKYGRSEGISIDNNFMQHGRQIYIGGYGQTYIDVVSKFAYLFLGTIYELPNDKKTIFCDLVRESLFGSVRGRYITFNAVGRNISRKGIIKKDNSLIQIAQRMVEIDLEHKSEYESLIFRLKGEKAPGYNVKTSHSHYYYCDYTLHVSPKYLFDVRMASNRTLKCESLNNENLKAYFLSYGSNSLMLDGTEYFDIFPCWDWARIPGTTTLHLKNIPMINSGAQNGESNFAGGVSDSIYGATAYLYADSLLKTSAKKSWFFFDEEIVCLGSDITSDSDSILETSINQCLDSFQKPLYVNRENGIEVVDQCRDSIMDSTSWVLFNNVGYLFPRGGRIILSKQPQSGSWYDINRMYIKEEEQKDIFYLGVEHGTNVKNGTYAYVVVPGVNNVEEMDNYSKRTRTQILECSSDIHSVYDSENDILLIVFFNPGILNSDKITVEANKPCALILKGGVSGNNTSLHIADICQTQGKIDISISSNIKKIKKTYYFTNSGLYAGKTKHYEL